MPKSIAILAPSPVPFQLGGAEKFFLGLRAALAALPDCWCELIKLPAPENSLAELVHSYKMFSGLDLSHFDALITSKYPAWIAQHPNHYCYLLHPLRGLYDTYHYTGLPEMLRYIPPALQDLIKLIRKKDPQRADLATAFELCERALDQKSLSSSLFSFPGPLTREVVHFFDKIALAPGQIKGYFAISATVAQRKDYLPANMPVAILHPPSDLTGFFCGEGEYFFTASRLNSTKRIGLLVDAMAYLPQNISLKIAGTGPDLEKLRQAAAHDPRIEFLGHVTDAELPALYAHAIAVPFVPLDEDYGLITWEAFKSGKAVVTVEDAGGVCELVEDGITGFVTEPCAPALGKALARLAADRELAARLGAEGRKRAEKIAWPRIAETIAKTGCGMAKRQLVVVASSFGADRHGAGGARRLYHLCLNLAADFDVELFCLGSQNQKTVNRRQLAPGLVETSFPWPGESIEDALQIIEETGLSGDDIAICRHAEKSAQLVEALAQSGKNACCGIVSHPWLFKALRQAAPQLPLVYEAQDIEADVKKCIFGAGPLLDEAVDMEKRVAKAARLILTCSLEDSQRMSKLYGINSNALLVLPNGCEMPSQIEPRETLRQRLPFAKSKLALFMGSGHKPNQDAALAIFSMARKAPDVEFLLAGSVSTQAAVRAAQRPENAHLLGIVSENVKNLLLQACDIALNPITSGSGTNLKLVEYLAFGLPCISTHFGARGMAQEDFPALRICELECFPQQIGEVLAHPLPETVLRQTAQNIASQFAWPNVLRPLGVSLIERLAECDS